MSKARPLPMWVCFVMGLSLPITQLPTAVALFSGWTSDTKNFWLGFITAANLLLFLPWIVIPLLSWSGAFNQIFKRISATPDQSVLRKVTLAVISGIAAACLSIGALFLIVCYAVS